MSRRRLRVPSCGSIVLGCVVVAAAGWVVLRAVVMMVAHHPEIALVPVVAVAGLTGLGRRIRAGRGLPLPARSWWTSTPPASHLSMSPAEFERSVADLCRRDGCRHVRVVGGAGDLAADVLADLPDGRRMLVQCKRYALHRSVGSPEVQRVGGTYAVVHHADLALVVTTGRYTDAAIAYARTAGIRLVDAPELSRWAAGGRPPWV